MTVVTSTVGVGAAYDYQDLQEFLDYVIVQTDPDVEYIGLVETDIPTGSGINAVLDVSSLPVGVNNIKITIKSASPYRKKTVTAQAATDALIFAKYSPGLNVALELQDIVIDGASVADDGLNIYRNAPEEGNAVTLTRVTVHSTVSSGFLLTGGNITLEDCIAYSCGASGFSCSSYYADSSTLEGISFRYCSAFKNIFYGFTFSLYDTDLNPNAGAYIIFDSCLAMGNSTDVYFNAATGYSYGNPASLKRNIVISDTSVTDVSNAMGIISYSESNSTTGVFSDYAGDDFHLIVDTSTIWVDSFGTSVTGDSTTSLVDFDGYTRTTYDVGAYSYQIVFPASSTIGTTGDYLLLSEWFTQLDSRAFAGSYAADVITDITDTAAVDITFSYAYTLSITSSTNKVVTVSSDSGTDATYVLNQALLDITISSLTFKAAAGQVSYGCFDITCENAALTSVLFTAAVISDGWDQRALKLTGQGSGTATLSNVSVIYAHDISDAALWLADFRTASLSNCTISTSYMVGVGDFIRTVDCRVVSIISSTFSDSNVGDGVAVSGADSVVITNVSVTVLTTALSVTSTGSLTVTNSQFMSTSVGIYVVTVDAVSITKCKIISDIGYSTGGATATLVLETCIFIGTSSLTSSGLYFAGPTISSIRVTNCGLYRMAYGMLFTNPSVIDTLRIYNTILMYVAQAFSFGTGVVANTDFAGDAIVMSDTTAGWAAGDATWFAARITKYAIGRTDYTAYFEGWASQDYHLTRHTEHLWFDNGNSLGLPIKGTVYDTPATDYDGNTKGSFDVGPYEDQNAVPAFIGDDLGLLAHDSLGAGHNVFVVNAGTAYDAYGNRLELTERVSLASLEFPTGLSSDADGSYAFLCMRKKCSFWGADYQEHPEWGFAYPKRAFIEVEFYLSVTVLTIANNDWPYLIYYPPLDDESMIDGVVLAKVYQDASGRPNMVYRSPSIAMKDGDPFRITNFA